MTPALALAAADPGAVLVQRRTTGVLHVYVGPLTRAGRAVPTSHRPVCRARTGRLTAVAADGRGWPVCGRCALALTSPRRQAQHAATRDQVNARYRHLTARDVVEAAVTAGSPAELAHVAHVALVVLGARPCGRTTVALHPNDRPQTVAEHLGHHRSRVAGHPDPHAARDRTHREHVTARRRGDRELLANDPHSKEGRIARLGINNATRR